MLQTNYRYKYNPIEMNKQHFLESFIIRDEIFKEIFDDIKKTDFSVPSQHFIIIGQRGQGKTTLLRKLYFEIEQDEKLSQFIIPLQFTEEQYQIRTLYKLWEAVAEYLEQYNKDLFQDLVYFMEDKSQLEDYELNCFYYLEKSIKAKNKKIILLIDNIDELLGKLKDKEQRQLREILLSSSNLKIIGASTKMLEQHYDYAKPFYEFFKIIKMNGLNQYEIKKLLRSIATNKIQIEDIIATQYHKIETLRQITGGVPRTFVMLFDIFIDDEGDAFDNLIKILDEVTPLYKHRMDDLPPILQEIVHIIALNWDGMLTKDIAIKTNLKSNEVSSHLKQLEKYHIIESTLTGKNKIYKIEERFFNIWYLMRFGKKNDRSRVEWLVKFLSTWYTKEELEKKSLQLIEASKKEKIKDNYLFYMCEALSYTELLDIRIEHILKKHTKEFLEKTNSDLTNKIDKSVLSLLKKASIFLNSNNIKDAIDLLEKSRNKHKKIYSALGELYKEQKDYKKAEEYYLKAIENDHTGALNNIGVLYKEQKDYKKAEKYYLKAIENGNNNALNNIGVLYKEQKDYKKAEEYYLKAIENGHIGALNNFALLYQEQKDYKKAEEYYLKAIENSHIGALNNIANLYKKQKDYKKAEEYYLKAIGNADIGALNNIGILYKEQKDYKKAEKYYLKAIENSHTGALNNIALLYQEQKDYKKAEEYYLKAIENADIGALNNIALLYQEQKDYKKAEEYYLKAIKNGDHNTLNNLAFLYQEQKDYKKAEEYYLKAIENGDHDTLNNLALLYQEQKDYKKAEEYYLKAIENGDHDTLNNLAWFYYEIGQKFDKAIYFVEKSLSIEKNNYNTHTLAILLLVNEDFSKSYKKFEEWLELLNIEDHIHDISLYLNLLIAKEQYYKVKNILEHEKYQLKEILKPIWYALMTLMQVEYPNEIKMMGSELQESVNDILKSIEDLKEKYKRV